jgi:hypothetical protein
MKPAASAILTALVCSCVFAFLPLIGALLLGWLVTPMDGLPVNGIAVLVLSGFRVIRTAAIIGFVVGLVGWAIKHSIKHR